MGDDVAQPRTEAQSAEGSPLQRRRRVSFLKVPIDIVEPDQLGLLAFQLLAEGKESNIVLLSLRDLLRARRKSEYRDYVQKAALVIPISKNIVGGVRFLLKEQAVRYMPFDFVVNILTMLESCEFSCYLLGGKKRILEKAEKNIRDTFPSLRVVGRFPGSFKRQEEPVIIEAIRKASPSLLLVGEGVRYGEHWIARNSSRLGKGMRLWCSDLLDVFGERKKRPSRTVFGLGLEWVGPCLKNPFRMLRIFPFAYYNLLLLVYKIFKRPRAREG